MPRNGSGTYSKVNTFAAGATITSSGHNQNWDDLATEMTNSVAADGQTSMTGALKATAGTAALPGLAFAADTNTGIYRIGGDNLGVACNGAKVLDVATTGVSVTGDVAASGVIKQGGFSLLPVGILLPYAGAAAPTGFLLCAGQSLLRASYPDLFTAISTTYGAADGTHFSLPDLRGRLPAGKDDMGGSAANRLTATYFGASSGQAGTTLGAVGGSESHALSTAELPAHSHGVTEGSGHQHVTGPAGYKATNTAINISTAGGTPVLVDTGATLNLLSTGLATTGISINNAGSNSPHAIVQPTIVFNYIIFAGV